MSRDNVRLFLDAESFSRLAEELARSFDAFAKAAYQAGQAITIAFEPLRRVKRSTPEFERQYLASASYGERFKYQAMRMVGVEQWRAFDILDEER